MKIDFKKAAARARSHVNSATLVTAFSFAMLGMAGLNAYQYNTAPGVHEAYNTCITEAKPCTPDEMALARKKIELSGRMNSSLMLGLILFVHGIGDLREKKQKEILKAAVKGQIDAQGKYYEEQLRSREFEGKLRQAEEKLAPYLAEDARKAALAVESAAKQELNQIAQDATTLQGQIKVGKKISIKPQTPPAGA